MLDKERTITTTITTLDCKSDVDITPKPNIMLQDDYEGQLLQSAVTYCLTVASICANGDNEQTQDYLKGIAFAITQ